MPIHRLPGQGKRSVWADPEELARWLKDLPKEVQEALRDESGPSLPPERLAESSAKRRWLPLVCALAACALLAVGFAAWRLLPSVRVSVSPRTLTAYDDDPRARALYLNARFEFESRTAQSLADAEKSFRQLVNQYPDRAPGWCGLSDTYILLREFGSMPDKVAFPKAASAARTAIALDPKLADAWLDKAYVAWWWYGDAATAFTSFETAERLSPNNARIYHWHATALETHGEFAKAVESIAKARALEPGNRAIVADEAVIRFDSGDHEEAVRTLEQMAHADPQFMSWHAYLAHAYLFLGRDSDFLRESETMARLRGQDDLIPGLRAAERSLASGGREAMLKHMSLNVAAQVDRGADSPVSVARFLALANDHDGMMHWLKIAQQNSDRELMRFPAFLGLTSFRSDPQVDAIVLAAIREAAKAAPEEMAKID